MREAYGTGYASYIAETRCGGWGFVIRDAEGAVIYAGAGGIPCAMDAFHAEVLACHAGLKAAIEKGMSRIVVESGEGLHHASFGS